MTHFFSDREYCKSLKKAWIYVTESITPETPYEILGEQGVKELANTFYEVMDELPLAAGIRAMHTENLDRIKEILATYLTGWMGGPPVYQKLKGTVCLNEPHERFKIGPKERDQWLECMDEALIRVNASEELKQMLKEPLQRIAEAVRNMDEPNEQKSDSNIIATDWKR